MIIRKINTNKLTKDNIPQDTQDVMEYFNKDLETRKMKKWIPRKTPITIKEIKNLWMPSFETNINFVAEDNGKVIGALTVFYDINSTEYEHKHVFSEGITNTTISSEYNHEETFKLLIKETIKELKKQNKKAYVKGAIECSEKDVLIKLGYDYEEIFSKEYKDHGLSGKGFICHLIK